MKITEMGKMLVSLGAIILILLFIGVIAYLAVGMFRAKEWGWFIAFAAFLLMTVGGILLVIGLRKTEE